MKSGITIPSLIETLSSSPFFKGMSERHLRTMAECAMPTEFAAGELVFREGDVANRFYLIQEGTVMLESRRQATDPICIQTIGAGDVLGWSWLFPPYLWHFDARAVDAVKVVFIYGSRLRDHCEDDHEFGYEFVMRMAEVMMRRLQATRWQLFQISEIALSSQREALQLAAQIGSADELSPKHFRPSRHPSHFKPQLTHKK